MLPARARSLNLTAALALAAVAELVLDRLVGRLFLPQHPTATLARLVAAAGRFSFHLGGVLGLLLLVAAIAGAFRRRELFPRSMRVAVALIALFFVVLATIGIVFAPLPERLSMHVQTSHAFLAWFMAMALWRSTLPVRTKMGVTLFALPAVLHGAALFAARASLTRPLPGDLARAAEICALLAAAASPLLIAAGSMGARRRIAGAVAGALVVTLMVAAFVRGFDLLHTIGLYGFGLDLPAPASPAAGANAALVVAAFAGLAVSAVWSLTDLGPARLLGYGLVLVTAAGYQAATPHQVVLSLCGLFAIAVAARRSALLGLAASPAASSVPAASPAAP